MNEERKTDEVLFSKKSADMYSVSFEKKLLLYSLKELRFIRIYFINAYFEKLLYRTFY